MTPQETEALLERLEEENEDLREEVFDIQRKLDRVMREAQRRSDPRALVQAAAEYLDWDTEPNPSMGLDAQEMVSRQLRGVLVDCLQEMGR